MTTWTVLTEYVTNSLPYSEDFEQWTASTMQVQASYADSPFGSNDATYIKDTSPSQPGVLAYTLNAEASVERTFSLFVKKDSRGYAPTIRMNYTSAIASVKINLNTGELTASESGSVDVNAYGVDDFDEYYRVWIASSAAQTLLSLNIIPSITPVTLMHDVVIFGAQLETGNEPSGYVATNGAVVTVKKRTSWVFA